MLDEAGFPEAAIVASNELDENIIASLREQGARVSVWGVGTRLITGHDQAAMGCVYKLSAVRDPGGPWRDRMKLSEQVAKVSNPGIQQVRRFSSGAEFAGDMIWHDEPETSGAPSPLMIDPLDMTRRRSFGPSHTFEDLLKPIFRKGVLVSPPETLTRVRERVVEDLAKFPSRHQAFREPAHLPGRTRRVAVQDALRPHAPPAQPASGRALRLRPKTMTEIPAHYDPSHARQFGYRPDAQSLFDAATPLPPRTPLPARGLRSAPEPSRPHRRPARLLLSRGHALRGRPQRPGCDGRQRSDRALHLRESRRDQRDHLHPRFAPALPDLLRALLGRSLGRAADAPSNHLGR